MTQTDYRCLRCGSKELPHKTRGPCVSPFGKLGSTEKWGCPNCGGRVEFYVQIDEGTMHVTNTLEPGTENPLKGVGRVGGITARKG